MGMDVYGENPSTEQGEYFRANVWYWHPLADYILEAAPSVLTEGCNHWHSNDGDGLDSSGSEALGKFLAGELKSGRTMLYENTYKEAINSIPLEKCKYCDATGTRLDLPDTLGIEIGNCNGCKGSGKVKSFTTNYPFDSETVSEFVGFLFSCGVFKIC